MADKTKVIVSNRKFRVEVLDPKDERRDNVVVTVFNDDGGSGRHHLRAFEVLRLADALHDAVRFGPDIPKK